MNGILSDIRIVLIDGVEVFARGVDVGRTTGRSVEINGAMLNFDRDVDMMYVDDCE